MGRTLAIGDIHGCLTALKALVEAVELQPDDMLVTLGDYVDRGPESRQVIDWLIERHHQGGLIALRGNHDLMMSEARFDNDARNRWISFGGIQTLQSYGDDGIIGTLDDIPDFHWDFIDLICRRYFETDRHIFVHAMLEPFTPLVEQEDAIIYWEKFRNPEPHDSGKIMVCGHTAQKSGLPISVGHAICVDTWVYGNGWLTCLDVDSGQYWQARQSGDSRTDWLELQPSRRSGDE